jgi:allophanate hydrolase subunit 1
VVETVPAYASLLVVFDPLQASPEALKRLIAGLCDFEDAGPTEDRTVVEIPVVYGGEAGPDLDAVAAYHGLSREA